MIRSLGLLAALLATTARADVTLESADLRVTFADTGGFAVLAKATGREWRSAGPAVSDLRRTDTGAEFKQRVGALELVVAATLVGPRLEFTLSADAGAACGTFAWPAPLTAALTRGELCFAPYANGVLVAQDNREYAGATLGPAFDLPLVGLTDGERGDGYVCVALTEADTQLRLPVVAGLKQVQPQWLPRLGKFGGPRRLRYEFVPSGGYVAVAKAYRRHAAETGLLVTFAEKRKLRPNVDRLAGAPDVWGGDLAWARDAAAAGVERCLLNTTANRAAMQAVNDLGWLTSRYDNYCDMFEEADPARWDNVKGGSDEVLLRADGSKQLAWLTYDKKTQYLKRSSRAMLAGAQRSIPRDLAGHPYLARFLDVTTADGLLEDWRAGAQQDRATDIAQRLNLFSYVNDLKLVTGGEHGRAWAVPRMDYFEGIMSGGHTSWPSGHLRHPENGLAGIGDDYRTWGLGAARRIPLWELVFHDCAVSYWYWGDSTDYLHRFDPGITDRKDALNVLYGTPPLYWVDGHLGFRWQQRDERARLLRSYFATCPWHAAVFGRELLSHRALTADRGVQEAVFAGGYRAVVNLGEQPYQLDADVLPPNGFVARGPGIAVSRLAGDGGPALSVRTASLRLWARDSGESTALRRLAEDRLTLTGTAAAPLVVRPGELVPHWPLAETRAYRLDAAGARAGRLLLGPSADGQLTLGPTDGATVELVTGAAARQADFALGQPELRPTTGRALAARVPVSNWGLDAAATLTATVDGRTAATAALDLPAWSGRAPAAVRICELTLASQRLVGPHRLAFTILANDGRDLLPADNTVTLTFDFGCEPAAWTRTLRTGTLDDAAPGAVVETTLPPGLAPNAALVFDADRGRPLPTQVEDGGRVVCTLVDGQERHLRLAACDPAEAPLPAAGWWTSATRRIETPVYSLDLADGTVRNLTVAPHAEPLATHLMYSSAVTGWTEEQGETRSLELLADGPVRSVIKVVRSLAGGATVYTKVYRCYADGFSVTTTAQPSVSGLHNRLYFAHEPLRYADSLGRGATIDGVGDAEIPRGTPAWFACWGPRGAVSCVPLGGEPTVAYWDASYWGGLGYSGEKDTSAVAFTCHREATGPEFAAADVRRWRELTWR